MCSGDALDYCQPEADACVLGADAFVAAKKWLGKRGDHLGRERLAGVLDRQLHDVGRALIVTQTVPR